jgi:hypothetical protein
MAALAQFQTKEKKTDHCHFNVMLQAAHAALRHSQIIRAVIQTNKTYLTEVLMSDTSPNLQLPFLQPSQAQKHVTHNTALERLDILVQLRLLEVAAITPPAVPVEGQIFALGSGATGDWAGHDGELAIYLNGGWIFEPPLEGCQAVDLSTGAFLTWQNGACNAPSLPHDDLEGVGIATTSDATNRFALASPAALFSHAGAGHQLKINKANDTETGTVLFQTNWSGRAEMGLAGEDDWSVKVSPDGNAWKTALRVDAASGRVGIGPEADTAQQLSVTAHATEPTIQVRNAGGNGGATFRMIDDTSGSDWKFKTTGDGSFKLRDHASGLDVLYLEKATRVSDFVGPLRPASFTVATLPDPIAAGAGSIVFVSDESGGAVPAFSDGSEWRRMTDRAVVT